MNINEIIVVAAAATLTLLLGWFFFGPRKSYRADLADGVQVVTVTVKGGYTPELIEVGPGVPVRLVFDRQESGDCSSRVVIPAFNVNQALPAFTTTAVEFLPGEIGEFGFACGMNMLHGRIRVSGRAPEGGSLSTAQVTGGDRSETGFAGDEANDAEAAERAAQIADLGRRVVWGALLSGPVVLTVMAVEVFNAG